MAESSIPSTYKRIVGERNNTLGKVEEVSVQLPGENQVLVRIHFAPINPADLGTMYGWYPGVNGKSPIGFEGSGVVAAVGTNLRVPHKVGDKVHVLGLGTWGEYITVSSESVFPIHEGVSLEEAASHFVNPGTVVYMSRLAKNHKAAIHTAGSSALGRQLIRYFKAKGQKLISIVRKKEYVEELLKEGADFVLNSSDADFQKQLKELAAQESATIAFDAIGGEFTGILSTNMPNKSTIHVYGALSGQPASGVGVTDLIFRGITVTGLWLNDFMTNSTLEEKLDLFKEIHSNLSGLLKSKVQKVFHYDKLEDAVKLYNEKSSEGKILFSSI